MAHYTTITSDKNKDTALLLCIFGGFFGLHQFYCGKIFKGMIYLCTGGLFFLGWIIDIFRILLGSFKDNTGAPLRASKKQNNAPTDVRIINQETGHTFINQESNIEQLERLAKLKDQGILSDEEFESKKRKLLQ